MKQPPLIIVQIVHIQGPLQGSIQEFANPEISIGRDPACDIHFPTDLTIISRRHAQIAREGNRFRLVDSSTNGTLVNGKPVKEAYLKDGDVITLSLEGPKLSFLTRLAEESERVNLQPPLPAAKEPVPRPVAPQSAAGPPPAPKPVIGQSPVPQSVFPPPQPILPPAQPVSPSPPPSPAPEQLVAAPLIVQYGPTLRCFDNLPVKIGRGPHCGVAIDLPGLSEEQALFCFSAGRYWVKDLTGTGVVQVNGSPVRSGVALQSNDRIMLSPRGPAFRFLGEGRLVEEDLAARESVQGVVQEMPSAAKAAEKAADRGKLSLFRKFFHDD